uniref:Uncharacterized protein n=1 Tax=viral metagenome TaxID=1070528 RepID=A0A6H2A4E5_9ZZZZ
MEIYQWANKHGYTLVLSKDEAEDLEHALKTAIRTGKGESETVDVEISE